MCRQVIPLQIHVDGAEMYAKNPYTVFSISSVLADTTEIMDMKFAVVKIPESCLKPKKILDAAMQKVADFMAWNFEILQKGQIPTTGFYGEPLGTEAGPIMGEYTAAFAFFKCDGKARKEPHRFKNHYNSTHCCDGCEATQPFPSVLKNPRSSVFQNCSLNLSDVDSTAVHV